MIDKEVMRNIAHNNTELLSTCSLISMIITRITELAKIDKTNTDHLLFYALFYRIVNSFSSAKLLISNGYIQDAGTIIRSLLETLFVLKACIDDNKYLETYKRTDATAVENVYKRYLQYTTRLEANGELDDSNADRYLRLYQQELEKYKEADRAKLNYCEAASKASLQDMYDLLYPHLSTINTHPSLRSLGGRLALDKDENVAELRLGPEQKNANWMLALLIQPMIVAIECIAKKFHLGLEKDIASIFEKFCEEREKLPVRKID
ncbi:MAG: DUF5677 domain-containing protein [Solidesulfovibrio sp.]|uniref:DUF5677 domain-containing protein n=1 Tax=Solidesulfovibrio sp. TaxID=2910990 RepID=UPI0031599596